MAIGNDPNDPSANPSSANQSLKGSSNGGPPNGSSDTRRTPGVIPLAQDSNPFDARNFDSGGFGFGGTNGSAGGFGVGGNGPQTGAYGSQSNYGQGSEAGGPDTFSEDFEHHNDWRDGLPHNFRGWGPQTPDTGPAASPKRSAAMNPQPRAVHPLDHHYLTWREGQMRQLDADYLAWRAERQGQFNQDFDEWRSRRTLAPKHTAEDNLHASAPPSAQGHVKKDTDAD
jgi:hypothetical protein